MARTAESAGLDSVWVADHVAFPTEVKASYPYSTDGTPFRAEDGFLEAITTLAIVAGATERIGLGTSVLVLPAREPLLFAKSVATLDVLSSGRVLVAIGAGWLEEEFEVLGAEFQHRGARMNEQIEILRSSWRHGTFAYTGEWYDIAEVGIYPLPVQEGGPPLLVGGLSPAARRRAAEVGDGWHSVGGDVQTLAPQWQGVQDHAASLGRDPTSLRWSTSAGLSQDDGRAAERLAALRDAGLSEIVLNFGDGSSDATLAGIDRLANSILPKL